RPDHHPRGARAQPQERHPVHPAGQAYRLHRTVGVRQVVARVRHHLRGRPTPLRRVAFRVRAAVPWPDGKAGRRHHRGTLACDLDRPEGHVEEPAVDRIVVGPEQRTRLVDSIETAARLGGGAVIIVPQGGAPEEARSATGAKGGLPPQRFDEEINMSQDYACPYDGTNVPEPEPRNFSFNNPHGACPVCTGLGSQLVVDADLVVPDPSLTLRQGAIAAWSRSQFFYPELLESVSKYFG